MSVRRLSCLALLLVSLPVWVHGDAEDAFRKGIQAADRGQWQEAASHFREAAAQEPQESDRRILISGVFSRPYLPHFYLGQALWKLGPENCEEVLQAWNTSTSQGVVQKNKPQLQELEDGSRTCNGLLLPPVIAAATREIERAAALSERLPDPLPTPEMRDAVEGARRNLAEARRLFETGRTASRLEDLRQAETHARNAGRQLADLEDQAQGVERQFRNALDSAQEAFEEAEQAEKDFALRLATPRYATVWRQADGPRRSNTLRTRLEATREALRNAVDQETATALENEAQNILNGYRQAEQQLTALIASAPPPAAAPTTDTPTASPTTAPIPTPLSETPSTSPERTSTEATPISEEALRRLASRAERLLARLDTTTGSELLETQRSRLTLLLREAREPTAQEFPRLRQRLEDSLETLRLLAGAHAYLAGRAEEAVSILAQHEVSPGPLAAQTHLFLAAARFSLYSIRGTGEASLLQEAAQAARQAHALDSELTLDPRAFSPSFQDFFAGAARGQLAGQT